MKIGNIRGINYNRQNKMSNLFMTLATIESCAKIVWSQFKKKL